MSARKVDERVFARIVQLRHQYGLTIPVIAERLGLDERTVRIYLRSHRLNQPPYYKEGHDVSS